MLDAKVAPHSRIGAFRWMSSLLGKITLFLLSAVFVTYVIGAGIGWLVMEQGQRRQWREQAELNAQIASTALRNIYTFVAVDMSAGGQITRILTERPIGDDQSVLDTGFVPADVLALATAQTKQKVWLFGWQETDGLRSISDGEGRESALPLAFEDETADPSDAALASGLRVGFMRIGAQEHFASFLPIVTPEGRLLGAVVASVGRSDDLLATRSRMLANTALLLLFVMVATALLITLLMRGLFRPVPVLIEALAALARNETDRAIPYQDRRDEIGRLAIAVETLRAAVVEREALRKVRQTAAEMEHLAHHDGLTGLPNRVFFLKALRGALREVGESGAELNLLLFDLDRFKPINDTFGHAAGDRVLVTTCERMRALLGPSDMVARLGGDEFAVLQRVEPGAAAGSGEWEARRLAAAMIEVASIPCEFDGLGVAIGVSVGIASAPLHAEGEADLLRCADIALYAAKDGGRARFRFFQPGMSMRPADGPRERHALMQALARGEFVLHYQPVVRLSDGGLWGYEALMRWNHPEKGLVSPEDFIALAETSGAILPLGRWVMNKACEDALGFEPGTMVSVNLSAVQVAFDDVPAMVEEALRRSGLPAERLEIELADSHAARPDQMLAPFGTLRALGVRIALDDFGTGHARLSLLADLPFTRVKIDRRFVADLMTSHSARSIVGGMLGIARELKLAVTAEGVETAEQAELLRRAGCETAQGYRFGRPAPALEWRTRAERACG